MPRSRHISPRKRRHDAVSSGFEDASRLPIYSVRLTIQADQDLTSGTLYLADSTDEIRRGIAWKTAIVYAIGTLATLPYRFPIAEHETKRFGFPTRKMVFREDGSSFAYQVFYAIDETGDEGLSIVVFHIRHGSHKPLSRSEAAAILQNH